MNIAVDAREAAGVPAGKGRYVIEIIKNLAVIDRQNNYFLYTKQPIDLELPANFEVVIIGGPPGGRQLWLAKDARRRDCQLLFAPTGYLPVIFSLIPCVATVHDLALFVTKQAKPALKTLLAERLLLGLAARKAKQIITPSQSTKNDLVKLLKIPADKITVTLLGYDKASFQPTAKAPDDEAKILKSYDIPDDYLLFIGTLEPRKNIENLIIAYAKLPSAIQDRHKLVIGGGKGWYFDSIFTTVKELKLDEKIQFLGRVPDEHLPALYRGAKLFVFPSFYEGFGLPPLEAMACGTPVITSNLSSLPEVVGEAGVLVDPQNPAKLASAIESLLTDKAAYSRLKKLSLEQAERFSWEEAAKQTLAVFEQVAEQSK